MQPRRIAIARSALLAGSASGDSKYEPPRVLKSSDFLDAAVLKGPHHEIDEKVVSDGVFNTYTVRSDYGTFKVEGTSLAALRVHEIGASAQLKEVDKIAVAAGAVAASLWSSGRQGKQCEIT